jgi:hypothetical protein
VTKASPGLARRVGTARGGFPQGSPWGSARTPLAREMAEPPPLVSCRFVPRPLNSGAILASELRRCRGPGPFPLEASRLEECDESSRIQKKQRTGCGDRADGRCRPGGGLRRAARCLCAHLPGPTHLHAARLYLSGSSHVPTPACAKPGATSGRGAVGSRFYARRYAARASAGPSRGSGHDESSTSAFAPG